MKNSAWYNKLWQDKMLELTIEGDGDAAWQKMQGLLDQHMPVSTAAVATKPRRPWWVKLISIIALIATVAVLYYVARSLFIHPHKNTIKQTSKQYAQYNTDSTSYKNNVATANNFSNNPTITDDGQPAEKTESPDKKTGTINNPKITIKPSTKNSASNVSAPNNHSTITGNHIAGSSSAAINESGKAKNRLSDASGSSNSKLVADLNKKSKNSSLSTTNKGLHSSHLQKQHGVNHSHFTKNGNGYKLTSKGNQHSLTNHLDSKAADNNNNGSSMANNILSKNASSTTTSKTDTTKTLSLKNIANAARPTVDTTAAKNKADKSSKSKANNKAKSGNSKFELNVKVGLNTNGAFISSSQNNNFYGKFKPDVFLGISATYRIHNKLGVAIGLNLLSPKLLSGSYSKSNLNYITLNDSNKQIVHNSGKLIIKGTRKVYSVDVPIMASYKATDRITITGGPVISIPVRTGPNKNTLGTLSSSADSTTVRTATPYVNSTTINNKVNFSFTAGVKYNVNRVYLEANYLQGINPYTISSSLGSGKINYHTIQVGIGFRLFKSKK